MSVGNWLLGYVLAFVILFVGLAHGWTLVWVGGIGFGILWWYVPDWMNHDNQEPPEDIR